MVRAPGLTPLNITPELPSERHCRLRLAEWLPKRAPGRKIHEMTLTVMKPGGTAMRFAPGARKAPGAF